MHMRSVYGVNEIIRRSIAHSAGFAAMVAILAACAQQNPFEPATDAGPDVELPEYYEFDSRFDPGSSSVDYSDQTAMHVLIQDLGDFIGLLDHSVDSADQPPFDDGLTPGEVTVALEYFFSLDADERSTDSHGLTTSPPALQATYGDLSEDVTLEEMLAGNAPDTDFRDFTEDFVGFRDAALFRGGAVDTPTDFVMTLIETIDANAVDRASGLSARSPVDPTEELYVHITPEGLDLKRLLVDFLLGAVAYHQAFDHYVDESLDGGGRCVDSTGLCADDTVAADGQLYTNLEHSWDQAFGAFGASTHYVDFTPRNLTNGPYFADHTGDDRIDLTAEYNFGASVDAARRDRGSARTARSDFMTEAWLGFLTGRVIITNADGALSDDELSDLRAARDRAFDAWEGVIAATVVHSINQTLEYFEDYGTDDFEYVSGDFLEHATDWSGLKAGVMMLQFSPRSRLDEGELATLNHLIGDAPVLPLPELTDDEAAAHMDDLIMARELIGEAFGFDEANLGDDDGTGGW